LHFYIIIISIFIDIINIICVFYSSIFNLRNIKLFCNRKQPLFQPVSFIVAEISVYGRIVTTIRRRENSLSLSLIIVTTAVARKV